jgi:hypothetical protein
MTSRVTRVLVALLACLLLTTSLARAQLVRSFTNPESATSCENLFGSTAVAASDTLVAISAVGASVGGKSHAGKVYLYDARSGALLRSLQEPTPGAQHAFGAALAVSGSRVLVGEAAPGTNVYAFDGASGALLQTFDVTALNLPVFGEPFPDEVVAFAGGNVVVATASSVVLFDGSLGSALRSLHADPSAVSTSHVAAVGGKVILSGVTSDFRGVVTGVDPSSGARVWSFTTAGRVFDPDFVAAIAGNVAVADPEAGGGVVHLLDGATGAELRRFAEVVPNASFDFGVPLIAVGDRLLTGRAPNGKLQVIDPTTGVFFGALAVAGTGGPLVAANGGDRFLVAGFPEQETEDPCSGVALFAANVRCDPATPGDCGLCSACDPNVGCVVKPRTSCRKPTVREASSLIIEDKADDTHDSLTWKWTRGAATGIDEVFGSLFRSDLALCVYDRAATQPDLVVGAGVGCGQTDCWKSSHNELSYARRDGSPDGVTSAKIKAGAEGRAEISIAASGTNLETPSLPLAPRLDVQLQSPDGLCWEADFSTPRVNTKARFQAKSD